MQPSPPPPPSAFTPPERALLARLRTPRQVQRWLNALPYNFEDTMRTLRGVVAHGAVNCMEGVLAAATLLERHGHPPLVLDIESEDGLGHVMLLHREDGRWGSIARSRDPGLHGRRPVYRSLRALVQGYVAPYIDLTGCITAYGLLDLRTLPRQDWRLGREAWFVERAMLDPRRPLVEVRVPRTTRARWRRRYAAFLERHPHGKPVFYRNRRHWLWP